jgi:hypothetical protein
LETQDETVGPASVRPWLKIAAAETARIAASGEKRPDILESGGLDIFDLKIVA